MSLTLSIAQVTPILVAKQPAVFTVTVTNTSSSAVVLTSPPVLTESTESDAQISLPQAPGLPIGYIPVLSGNSSFVFQYTVIIASPQFGGQNPPLPATVGGITSPTLSMSTPGNNAIPPDSFFTLQAVAAASDGSVGSTSLQVLALPAVAPQPFPTGGAFQFNSGFDLINGLVTGVL